ncbi:MAG TPA: hypothetical protein VLB76_01355 [Thermoanaerobaculia bacterium]|jgi:hypothetical protein|nr:hypothetical protein [Thermoanaerobaculia bacterium]
MTVQSLNRIQFVTRHFNELQGLRYGVPVGLITLSVGGTTYFSNRPFLLLRAAFLLGGLLLLLGSGRFYRRTFGRAERQPVQLAQLHSPSVYSPAGPAPRLGPSQRMTSAGRRVLITMGLALTLLLMVKAINPAVIVQTDESLVQAPWLSSSVVYMGQGVNRESFPMLKAQLLYALYGSFFLGIWFWRERRPSQSYYLVFGVLLLGCSALSSSVGFILPWSPRVVDAFFLPIAQFWLALLLCGSAMILAGLIDHWQLVRVFKPAVEE